MRSGQHPQPPPGGVAYVREEEEEGRDTGGDKGGRVSGGVVGVDIN